MDEHHLRTARTARYFTLGEIHPGVRQVWIACHGYAQLAGRFLRDFAAIASPDRLVVAPEALNHFYLNDVPGKAHGPDSRVGATWMTREDRAAEIDDYVEYLDTLHAHLLDGLPRAGVRVCVLGFSQGAETAARWAAYGSSPIDELILWGGLPPQDLDWSRAETRLAGVPVTLVAGERDPLVPVHLFPTAEAAFHAHGIACRLVRFPGGHEIDAATLAGLAGDDRVTAGS